MFDIPDKRILQPGATIGIFGGGQLGRMLAMAARNMDFRTISLDPAKDCPASQVCDDHIAASYDNGNAADELASRCDVVTYEFENVDARAIERIALNTEVLPSPSVLRITQDRELEKQTMQELGIDVPDHKVVDNFDDASKAVHDIGVPVVMKTTRWGYDGKGQRVVHSMDDVADAFEDLSANASGDASKVIVEKLIDFEMEISVVCARDRKGEIRTFPASENVHTNSISDLSIVPARCDENILASARDVAIRIAEGINVVGLIAVEMFVTKEGAVLVNETAPRPHNSGHYSIEGCVTSQFEQLTRILTGMPMGDTKLLSASVMSNLLGDIWLDSETGCPDWSSVLSFSGAHLHIYGKSEARRGRKMGHITAIADNVDAALDVAIASRAAAISKLK